MKREKEKVSGWQEWLALPEIGIPGIDASIETSAEFSTLQVSFVEHYRCNGDLWVRFGVTPLPQRNDIRIVCQAPVKKHHTLPVSESREETFFVIESPVEIDGRKILTELVLRRSEIMDCTLRLGRDALMGLDLLVTPHESHRFGKPDESLYNNQLKSCHST